MESQRKCKDKEKQRGKRQPKYDSTTELNFSGENELERKFNNRTISEPFGKVERKYKQGGVQVIEKSRTLLSYYSRASKGETYLYGVDINCSFYRV